MNEIESPAMGQLTWTQIVNMLNLHDEVETIRSMVATYGDGKIEDIVEGLSDVDLNHIYELAEFVSSLDLIRNTDIIERFTNIEEEITELKEKVVVFIVNGLVKSGVQDSHIILPFDCKLNAVTLSATDRDDFPVKVTIQKSTDYETWIDVPIGSLELESNIQFTKHIPSNEIQLVKDDILRLNIETISLNTKHLNVNLAITQR